MISSAREIESDTLLQVAVHFWAPWSAPCKQMDLVFAELAAQCPTATFLRVRVSRLTPGSCAALAPGSCVQVEAEEVSDVTERYSVSMVPHFVLFKVSRTVTC